MAIQSHFERAFGQTDILLCNGIGFDACFVYYTLFQATSIDRAGIALSAFACSFSGGLVRESAVVTLDRAVYARHARVGYL